jgi:hypothetical protein
MRNEGLRRHRAFKACLFATLGISALAHADEQTAVWNGGNGSWTNASFWSGGAVPSNSGTTGFDVQIDGGKAGTSSVLLNSTASTTIDDLTVDEGDNLAIFSNLLTINSSLTVNGTLNLGSVLHLSSNNASIDGNGTVISSGGFMGFSNVVPQGGSLTVGPNLTVVGGFGSADFFPESSSFGVATATLINEGHILAQQLGGTEENMLLVGGSTIENLGTMEAKNGGILGINVATFTIAGLGHLDYHNGTLFIEGRLDNTGQILQIDSAHGSVDLGGTISGGTITTGDGKSLSVPAYSGGLLDNVAINGTVVAHGFLQVPTGQSFSGKGDILLQNVNFGDEITFAAAETGSTTIGNGLTIHGEGTLGNHGQALTNNGTIRADLASTRIVLDASSLTNEGTLEADNGASLSCSGSITFSAGSSFVVSGSGSLGIAGNLDLSQRGAFLDVLPRPDGSAYVSQTIIAYTGTRIGTFQFVTPGITVAYGSPTSHVVLISGTPVPEPCGLIFVLAFLDLSRRGRIEVGRGQSVTITSNA